MYNYRLVTNLKRTDDETDTVLTDDIYTKYTAYVQAMAPNVRCFTAAKTKIGVAIRSIFGTPQIRSSKQTGESKYQYSKLRFYGQHEDNILQDELKIPEFATCGADENLFLMHVPSNTCYDGERLGYTVTYELKDEEYMILLDDQELQLKRLGIAGTEPLNARLTQGLGTLLQSLRICEGCDIDFEKFIGLNSTIVRHKFVSTYLEEVTATGIRKKRSFSKNCLRVLLVTAEHKKKVCQQCVKDLTQVKTNYQKKKAYENAAAELLNSNSGILADILNEDGASGPAEEAVGAVGGVPELDTDDLTDFPNADLNDTVS